MSLEIISKFKILDIFQTIQTMKSNFNHPNSNAHTQILSSKRTKKECKF